MYKGIIMKGISGLYTVRLWETGETVLCRARGKFRLDGITPLPGDEVLCQPNTEDTESDRVKLPEENHAPDTGIDEQDTADYVIREILPRRNTLIRPPIANLSHLFIVLPCASPSPDLLMADKLTCIATAAGIRPVMLINKSDIDPSACVHLTDIYHKAGFPVFPVSAVSGDGMDRMEKYLWTEGGELSRDGHPMRAAFAGVSGAGKSTLMTRLFPGLSLKTNTVSRKIERGRHTTRHVELYLVTAHTDDSSAGHEYFLADTPGFSMLDFTRFNLLIMDELPGSFPEFADCLGECRYTRCTHTREEGCAVLEKLARGEIAPSRHENFISIGDEIRKKPEWKRQKEEENGVSSRQTDKRSYSHKKRR